MEYNDPTFFESVLAALWPVWAVIRKIFIIPLIALGIGFAFWAAGRAIKKLKIDLEAFPGITAIEVFGVLADL